MRDLYNVIEGILDLDPDKISDQRVMIDTMIGDFNQTIPMFDKYIYPLLKPKTTNSPRPLPTQGKWILYDIPNRRGEYNWRLVVYDRGDKNYGYLLTHHTNFKNITIEKTTNPKPYIRQRVKCDTHKLEQLFDDLWGCMEKQV